jgi:hypothetical protein
MSRRNIPGTPLESAITAEGRRCDDHRRTGQMPCALSQSMPETTANRRHIDRYMVQTLESTFLHRLTTGYENYSHTIFAKYVTRRPLSDTSPEKITVHPYTHIYGRWNTTLPKCGYSYRVHPQSGHRSGRTSTMFQSMAQSAPHAIAWYMTSYRSRSAHFEAIASPLLNVPTATHPTPYSSIHGMQRNYWHMALNWPSSSEQTSVTSLPPRHVAAFSQYVNMAQPQTRSHLMGRRSNGLYCY